MLTHLLVSLSVWGSSGVAAVSDSSPWGDQGWNASPLIRTVCAGLDAHECVAAAESAFLATSARVVRDGDSLVVHLEGGGIRVFMDSKDQGGFTYLGKADALPYHIVMFWYEDTDYYLIHSVSGWQVRIPAIVITRSGAS